jgi:hypothetical protein
MTLKITLMKKKAENISNVKNVTRKLHNFPKITEVYNTKNNTAEKKAGKIENLTPVSAQQLKRNHENKVKTAQIPKEILT